MVEIGPVVSEEKSFEIVDGRTTEAAYTNSSPGAFGSGELKIQAPVNSLNMKYFDSSVLKHIKHICAHKRTVGFLKHSWGQFHKERKSLKMSVRSFLRSAYVGFIKTS